MRAKPLDQQHYKVLRALTFGLVWQAKDTWFSRWVNPLTSRADHKVQSILKPWYVFGAIAAIFYFRFAHGHGSEATNVWGIVIPLGLALAYTWTNFCIFVAGPKHEVEGFYVAQAAMIAVGAGLSVKQHERKKAQASYDQQLQVARQAQAEAARRASGLPF